MVFVDIFIVGGLFLVWGILGLDKRTDVFTVGDFISFSSGLFYFWLVVIDIIFTVETIFHLTRLGDFGDGVVFGDLGVNY